MSEPVENYSESERGGPLARRIGLTLGPLLFLFLLMAPGLPLDGPQRAVAAVTALTGMLWITVAIPVGAASLLPAVLFPLLSIMPAKDVAPMYMRDLVLLFIGAFIIALGLERWGVHRRIALFIIAKLGSSKRTLILGFMAAAAFLSMWISNTATTLLMLPIVTAVVARVDGDRRAGQKGSPFALCLLLGVAYSASVGGMSTPVGTAPNQEFLGQMQLRYADGPRISFGEWVIAWLPLVLLFVPLAWLLLTRVIFKVESGGASAVDVILQERAEQGPMSRPQLSMSIVFACTAVLWVTRADLVLGDWTMPGWSRLFLGEQAADPGWYRSHKNDISDATVASLMALFCFFMPSGRKGAPRGEALMDWRTAAKLPWEVLLLLGAGFCLAQGFKVSGLDRVLGESLSPLLAGHSTWLVVGGIALFLSLLTEITSNTATTAVLLPVVAAAAESSSMNPLLLMAPATIAASAAFMMPAATPPNAVVFSSRMVPVPTMARAGLWLNFLAVGLITLVFQLWVRRVWGIGAELPDWAVPK